MRRATLVTAGFIGLVALSLMASAPFAATTPAARSKPKSASAPAPAPRPTAGGVPAGPTARNGQPLPDRKTMMELNAATQNSQRAPQAIRDLRNLLGMGLDASYENGVRQMLLRALLVTQAPPAEILAAVDSLGPFIEGDPNAFVAVHAQVAQTLLERHLEMEQAYALAQKALAASPSTAENATMRASVAALVGAIALERGNAQEAVDMYVSVIPVAPDSQSVLVALGRAYEMLGKDDLAIAAYVRSLGVFASDDTSAAAPLRALARKHRRSDKEIAARVEAARRASIQSVALDSRREERPAPPWSLPDFDGNIVESSSLLGKVVVLDFWGSWCGPCRAELPYFQKMYERYKDRGVVFMGISSEHGKTNEERHKSAKTFIDAFGFTFPVVIDHERKAVEAYQIQGLPTAYMIDKKGQIRYANVGFHPSIDRIMTEQIESLLRQ